MVWPAKPRNASDGGVAFVGPASHTSCMNEESLAALAWIKILENPFRHLQIRVPSVRDRLCRKKTVAIKRND